MALTAQEQIKVPKGPSQKARRPGTPNPGCRAHAPGDPQEWIKVPQAAPNRREPAVAAQWTTDSQPPSSDYPMTQGADQSFRSQELAPGRTQVIGLKEETNRISKG